MSLSPSERRAAVQAGPDRREFLRAGALAAGTMAFSIGEPSQAVAGKAEVNCILLFLVGGPSHLDTWDLKPEAPENVRGPFRPIRTNVPGIWIGEHFPRMARGADQYALVRSVHHQEAPIHETGHQLLQTGRLYRNSTEHPHIGAVVSRLCGPARGAPPFALVPGPIENTGVSVDHGQTAGYLGSAHQPQNVKYCHNAIHTPSGVIRLPAVSSAQREQYGLCEFGWACLQARRLVERGVRLVAVNMFQTVFDEVTWDCHADGGSLTTRLDDYKTTLCPMFDQAYTALLEDLRQRGLLDSTLVVAMGEFGRTPQLNPRGGRDHWPGCWTILFAGAGVRGGQVVGSSDKSGAEPRDRPVTPAEVAATIYQALGIDGRTLLPGPDHRPIPLVEAAPIMELFRG